MTIKNIALALLAIPSSMAASQRCAPEALEPHFAIEFAAGGSTMNGPVQSKTTKPELSTGMENLNFIFLGGIPDGSSGQVTVPVDYVPGYQANWHQMTPLPSQMAFAGQINMHYNYMCDGWGAGVYLGVGHNSSRSSSTIPGYFNSNIQTFQLNKAYSPPVPLGTPQTITGAEVFTMDNNLPSAPLQARVGKTKTIPMGKATVASGLMFQAGGRFGPIIGAVHPHLRLGWALYQYTAQMTNQHAPWINNVPVQARANCQLNIVNDGSIGIQNGGIQDTEFAIGSGQYMASFDGAYQTNTPIKIKSKPQWTNAVTIGAGLDWAFHKMTVGFLYQVAICQKLTFKKWNKDVTSGLTGVYANLVGTQVKTLERDKFQGTGGSVHMLYGKHTPEVSITPVIHTALVSVKYIIGKAA